jgi:nucleotide-binding universal stress UspA family protein
MYRSILVPLDGSVFAEHALPLALGIARRSGAKLVIARVHVAPFSPIEDLGGLVDRAARDEEQAYLKAVVKQLTDETAAYVQCALLEIPVADSLCEYAKSAGADLIVMTTHRRGPLARAWLGSVADELVRKAPIPILLARPQEAKPVLDHFPVFRRVLVPLDGSSFAEQAVDSAVALGSLTEAEFILVRVIEPMVRGGDMEAVMTYPSDPGVVRRLELFHDEEKASASAYLEKVAQRLKSRGHRAETRVVVSEQAAVALLDATKQAKADLIALSTHGRRGLSRLFLGSVADKVLRGTSLPILIHRPAAAQVGQSANTMP